MQPGTVLSHYEILAQIGAGGMGVVYKARDLRLDRHVAIKVLASDRLEDPAERNRFVREAKTASALNHPNIVTIYDIDTSGDIQFIAMEYVEGQPLSNLIPSGGLPFDQVLGHAVQVTEAMGKAHAAGITHRDLKPGNIMVTGEGRLKILDFGLAKKQLGSDDRTVVDSLTTTGMVVGTVAYMAPEQALGEEIDGRSDIFSFGIILYEMLAGAMPFTGKTAIATLQKILHEEPPALSSSRPGILPAFEAIVRKAVAKSPALRYQTMEALRADLWKVSEEIIGVRQVRRSRFRPGQAVLRYKWAVAGLVVAVVLASQAGALVRRMSSRSSSAEAVDPTTLPATAMEAVEWVRRGAVYLKRYDFPDNIDRAIAVYQKALERDPNYAAAHAALAEAYLLKNSARPDPQWIRQATEASSRALSLNPNLAAAHLAQGRLLTQTKKPDEGAQEYQRAIDQEPRNATAHLRLAEYEGSRGNRTRAEELFAGAANLDPGDWLVPQLLGLFYFRNGRYEEAAKAWEKALSLSPDNVLVYRNLGGAFHMLDKWEQAASSYQRALEIQPSAATAGVYSNLGTARFFQGRYSDAVIAFEKSVELNPTWYLYWGNLGDAHRWIKGNEQKAKDAYTRAIELTRERLTSTKGDPELLGSLAVYYAKSGDKQHAAGTLAELEQSKNRTPGTYFKALVSYEVIGERDRALKSMESALKSGYSEKEIKSEPELSALRGDRRYHEILLSASKH